MLMSGIRRFFAAAPHARRLPEEEVRRVYPRLRLQILEATFVGYATFYLVRNNLSVVLKDVEHALGYSESMTSNILAVTAISYGLGKFLMGAVSDRSNPRTFMATGLLLTAICNIAFGAVGSYPVHLALWSMNGFFQGMGWPPCGRSMGHWFAEKERGLTFSIWNTSHNVGGGIAGAVAGFAAGKLGGWQYGFYVPAVLALIGSVYLFRRLRDTPQSVGLPPIEEYRPRAAATLQPQVEPAGGPSGDVGLARGEVVATAEIEPHLERELSYRELLFDYVLTNKVVWLLALANFFAYISRYSMLDYAPTYLREVKGADVEKGGLAVLVTEFGGIPSTILLGWVSDLLGGRRGIVAALCMLPMLGAFIVIVLTPAGHLWLDMAMLAVIGFFVYPVINFIVIIALDLTSKKAIGTAAGFIGLFGYIGRMVQAKGIGWLREHYPEVYGTEVTWQIILWSIVACTAIGMFLLAFTWRLKPSGTATRAG